MGGSGESQAMRTMPRSLIEARSGGSRFARGGFGPKGLQDRAEGCGLFAERCHPVSQRRELLSEGPELLALPGSRALDPPVQLLEKEVGAGQEVLREPVGEVGTPGQHGSLDVLDVELALAVVQLVRELAH